MSEIIQSKDCVVFLKGDAHAVAVSQEMVDLGWPGGQGVQWADVSSDERVVTFSTGLFGGFVIWGSDEAGSDFAANTRNQLYYRFATVLTGSNILATSSFEQYTYASRLSGPPYVALSYEVQDDLYFSRRGLWTKEDEMTLAGDSLAPASRVGVVIQVPRAVNRYYLGVQTFL